MTGIAEWLASIGLGEYAQRFSENAIDLSVVSDLTEQDLKDLGVLLGHRRKMLRAIGELQAPFSYRQSRHPSRCRERTLNGARSPSCFAIWWARPNFQCASIPRTCGG
jgi:hypothetical protein